MAESVEFIALRRSEPGLISERMASKENHTLPLSPGHQLTPLVVVRRSQVCAIAVPEGQNRLLQCDEGLLRHA